MNYGIKFRNGKIFIFTSLGLFKIDSSPNLQAYTRKIDKGNEWCEIESIEIIPEIGLIGIFAILETCYWKKENKIVKIIENEGNKISLPSKINILPIIFKNQIDENPETNTSLGIPIDQYYPFHISYVKSESLKFFQCLSQDHLYAIRKMSLSKANYQFRLLKAFSTDNRFFQLFQSNKALAFYYFYSNLNNSLMDDNMYQNLLNKKQREIGIHFGFYENEISFLRKIEPEILSPKNIRILISFFRLLNYKKMLRNMTYIYPSTFYFLLYLKRKRIKANLNLSLVEGIEESLSEILFPIKIVNIDYTILYSAVPIPKEFQLFFYLNKLNPNLKFSSLDHLINKGKKVAEKILEDKILKSSNYLSSKAPYPGNLYIEPILLEKDLYLEGKLQENCVYSAKEEIESGDSFFYRVTYPERATLQINFYGKQWYLSELKTYRNSQPNEITWVFVKDWLDENDIKYDRSEPYFKNRVLG